jgi:predicted N-acetyltransferase YhbS
MEIRPYQPEDDPLLLELERQSPRGFPHPFVHFRRRFIDRANMYKNSFTLVAVADGGQIVGVTSIIVRKTLIGGEPMMIAYSFDTRVHPKHRRHGIGHALVEEKLKWAQTQGAIGVYSLIVTTNQASLGMVAKSGYQKIRLVLYFEFSPAPMIDGSPQQVECHTALREEDVRDIHWYYGTRDLYTPNISSRLTDLEFQRWTANNGNDERAGISVYNQSKIYAHLSADAPWPRTELEIDRLGRNLKLFDLTGIDKPALLKSVFDTLRDEAVVYNVNKLTVLFDKAELIPRFIMESASHQTDYWLMFKPFYIDAIPNWTDYVYLDPRDL